MPQFQPFWDPAYSIENPGPYGGLGERSFSLRGGRQVTDFDTPAYGYNGTFSANPWDSFTAKGFQFPGLCTVAVTRSRSIYVFQQPQAPPTAIKVGWEPLRFTVTVKLWTPKQWEVIQPIIWDLQPIVAKANRPKPKKGDAPFDSAFDVYHPNIAAQSCHSAICEKIGPLTGGQDKTIVFSFLEYTKKGGAVARINEAQVADPYNADVLANQAVRTANGGTVSYTPTQGPQQKPSQSVSLTPTSG